MPEVVRIYNRDKEILGVMVEPWGAWYEVMKGPYLSIHVDSTVGIIEIYEEDGVFSIFLNDAIFDDLTTSIERSRYT